MRNMIEENKKAFLNLTNQLLLEGEDFKVKWGKRFLQTSEEEKEWLKTSVITQEFQILPSARANLFKFKDETFITVIGLDLNSTNIDSEILKETEIDAGIITLLLSENRLRLSSKINHLSFYDNIMFQHLDKSYKGHDYKDLIPFLEPIIIFKLPSDSVIKDANIEKLLCFILSQNEHLLYLNFERRVLDTFSEISLVGSDNISFHLILNCLLSTSYKHAFLEIYRLVERLFPISYLKEFHELIDTKVPFLEFSGNLENITSWKPREEDAIEKIFHTTKEEIKFFFTEFIETLESPSSLKDFKYVYQLRNSIVHFRANHQEVHLSEHQWNLLIIATLFLLDEQYSKYHELLKN